jgi:hypothetical protein
MNKQEKINELIEQAINSTEGAARATPPPFLLTRINARLNKSTANSWEKISLFIGRPSIAITGLAMLMLVNVLAIVYNKTEPVTAVIEQTSQESIDEFSYTAATTIYDIDNTEPQ